MRENKDNKRTHGQEREREREREERACARRGEKRVRVGEHRERVEGGTCESIERELKVAHLRAYRVEGGPRESKVVAVLDCAGFGVYHA